MNHLVRNLFIICLALALAFVGVMQGRRAFNNAKSRRLTAEAVLYFKTKDYTQTSKCLEAALKANWSNIEAIRLMAEMLDAAASPAAISWRVRASQLKPLNTDYRLDWAQTAVKLHDFKSLEDALNSLDEDAKSTARYHKLAGALAWGQGKTEEAERHFQEARRLEPGNPSNIVNLSTIGLSSTNEEMAASARLTLQALAATNSPYAFDALRRLAQEAARRKDFPEAVTYARRVVTNSSASFLDKLDCLNLFTITRSPDAAWWLASLEQQATNSPMEIVMLGRSLFRTVGPTNTLNWLSSLSHSLRTNQPVPLVITDCQIAVQDWPELLSTVANQEWGDSETLRLALESLARRALHQEDASQGLWKRARRNAARHLDRLHHLAQLAHAWGWAPERKDVLIEIVSEFPREKWAVDLLIAQFFDDGQTGELEQLVSKLASADPGNVKLKASLARLYLLRKNQLPAAYRMAKEAFDSAPEDPLVLSTYAYSLLLQGQQEDAVRALASLKPQALQIPWVAASYGVIEARSGNKQAARQALERAQTAKLLPEEMALVRQAAN